MRNAPRGWCKNCKKIFFIRFMIQILAPKRWKRVEDIFRKSKRREGEKEKKQKNREKEKKEKNREKEKKEDGKKGASLLPRLC